MICPKCGREIVGAPSPRWCPYCGYDTFKEKRRNKMNNPQSLNLGELIRKIEDDLLEEDSEILDDAHDLHASLKETIQYYTDTIVSKTIEYAIDVIRQRLKSACDFFLRYKDNPELLMKEHPEYVDALLDNGFIWEDGSVDKHRTHIYNDWLFRLAFKPVLGDDVDEA